MSTVYTTVQKFGFIRLLFLAKDLCSPKVHLFDRKYNKYECDMNICNTVVEKTEALSYLYIASNLERAVVE